MDRIIFATDFSPVAQNAATYAAHLAHFLKKELLLFHVYIIPFSYSDSGIPLLNEEEVKHIAETSIEIEQKRLAARIPELSITAKILPGDFIECLQEEIEAEQTDLLVIGTSGDEADSILWGSMAVRSLRSFQIPVLAIPSGAVWHPVENICFAADYRKITETSPFNKIADWVEKMNANIDVVFIDTAPNEKIKPPELLQAGLQKVSPNYHSLSSEDIVNGVKNFIEEHHTDWLMLIPAKYGFWKNLFHRSKTKMLTQVSHIPVLALHQA